MNSQQPSLLEEKLREHIQREFTLGEKVISLLKEKKDLETSLHQQQANRKQLEKTLEKMIAGKEDFEQKYSQVHRELQDQQQRLRSRSRIIVDNEEHSRTSLIQLRKKIVLLEKQLEHVGQGTGKSQKRLLHQIQQLRQKEQEQTQQFQNISRQRDRIEKRLHGLTRKYQHLSYSYQKEKQEHERQLEKLFREQIAQETRGEQLLEKHQQNEERLQQQITNLNITKEQLEHKLKQAEQRTFADIREQDAQLLQVIEKQQQYIEELKERTHNRSIMLRGENDNLRKEMETMLTAQEQMKWENQMLESSLKGLQGELAEYMELQRRFEEAQREKETFEEQFQRKMKFFESQTDTPAKETPKELSRKERLEKRNQQKVLDRRQFFTQSRKSSVKSRFIRWLGISNDKLLNSILLVIVVLLTVQIVRLIPWKYLLPHSPTTTENVIFISEKQVPDLQGLPEADFSTLQKELRSTTSEESSSPAASSRTSDRSASSPSFASLKAPPSQRKRVPAASAQPTHIIVKLVPKHAERFLIQTPLPLPTVETNSILRRRSAQTSSVSKL